MTFPLATDIAGVVALTLVVAGAYTMVVATEGGAGLSAAIVSAVAMVWGVVVAVRWCRSGAHADAGEHRP